MRPDELNALIALFTNYLYRSLTEKEFVNLGIFLSLLSRDMLSMEAMRDLCKQEKKAPPEGGARQ